MSFVLGSALFFACSIFQTNLKYLSLALTCQAEGETFFKVIVLLL